MHWEGMSRMKRLLRRLRLTPAQVAAAEAVGPIVPMVLDPTAAEVVATRVVVGIPAGAVGTVEVEAVPGVADSIRLHSSALTLSAGSSPPKAMVEKVRHLSRPSSTATSPLPVESA